MIYATAIRLNSQNRGYSQPSVQEIDSIYLEGCSQPGFYKKEDIHDFLKKNPNTIKVKVAPFPYVIPVVGPAPNYEKFVKSSPNNFGRDNLLSLPVK